jgi:hypothetical protein
MSQALEPGADWERKRRLDRVFGEVLPDTTGDERGEPAAGQSAEDWLKEQVPPHHGG